MKTPELVKKLLQWEKELMGVYLSDHPMGAEASRMAEYVTHFSEDMNEEAGTPRVLVGGVVTDIKKVTTKKKQEMAVVTLEDLHGSYSVVVFPQVWAVTKNQWVKDDVVIVVGDVSQKEDPKETSVLSDQMWRWEDVKRMTPNGFRNIATTPPKGRRGPAKTLSGPPISERDTTFATFKWEVWCGSVHNPKCPTYDAHHERMAADYKARLATLDELPTAISVAQDVAKAKAIGMEPLWPVA